MQKRFAELRITRGDTIPSNLGQEEQKRVILSQNCWLGTQDTPKFRKKHLKLNVNHADIIPLLGNIPLKIQTIDIAKA